MPTPAAVFIASEPWLSVEGDAERFETAGALWASKDRKQRPPRYVDRPREGLVDLIDEEKRVSAVLFDRAVGLRDWSDTTDVISKLDSLAQGSGGLEPRERVNFRRIYQRVWAEACKAAVALPADMPIATVTSLGFAVLVGNAAEPRRVFVTGDPLRAETKAVMAAGQPVLELSDEDLVGPALDRLQACGGFDALGIDRNQVDVLVDGVSMVPNIGDPLIASGGLDWLPEAAVLANEVLGRELERQISSSTIEQRCRRIRLRLCNNICLAVGGVQVDEALPFFAFPDDENPTLVAGQGQDMTWAVLADAAPYLSSLLDRRMRSLETFMLRLAHRTMMPDPRQRPTDEELARALGCKVELVRDHALALRADGDLLVGRLMPIVACATDLETARALGQQIGDSPLRTKVLEALRPLGDRLPASPEALLDEIAKPDLAQIRRSLGLDYGRLNQMLAALGQPILSNETELRRLFETWKSELGPDVVERLRRHFWPAYQTGTPLHRYVALRTLSFLEFQTAWVFDREELLREDVAALVDSRLAQLVGDDVLQIGLEPLAQVRARSTRTLQRFIDEAAATIGAWCHLNQRLNTWSVGAIALLKTVDQLGLLDFAGIDAGQEIATLVRAGAWPDGMPHTADAVTLGLDPTDLLGEKKRDQERREQVEIERRSIPFGDNRLDTRSPTFAQSLVALAQAQMADGEWLTRSRRRFKLVEQAQPDGGSGRGSGERGGQGRRKERLSDDIRSAMGFASEYLASCYLREKHKDRYEAKCWVSRNRGKLEFDGDGDDDFGYDFKVLTAETEWRYEVKSNIDDALEFEFTRNEMRSAAECASDGSRKYRVLYVPFVFQPDRWRVMELPNLMSEQGRRLFTPIGVSATRYKFEVA